MKFESFGYRGSFVFTPPLVFKSQSENLIVAATPYGNSADLENCLAEFLNEFENQSSDLDATSPYPKLTCFNGQENLLYTCLQFLNDYMYSNYNKSSINLGCDLFCALRVEDTIYFSQIGWPLILLHRDKRTLPICSDYSFLPKNKEAAPYIPSSILGTESSVNLKIQQTNLSSDSELLLLKSNDSPDSLLSIYPSPLKSIANAYAEENPEQGFWLGKISL
ncbi:MAG: hypothetical protein ACRBBP_08270 [Bdellovibrionales bacterium]